MKRNLLALAVSAAMTASLLGGCGGSNQKTAESTVKQEETTKAPESDGKSEEAEPAEAGQLDLSGQEISILGSYHEDMVKRLAEMFEERTGCKVSYLRMPTGEAVAKMTAEKDNPSVNVYLGGTVAVMRIWCSRDFWYLISPLQRQKFRLSTWTPTVSGNPSTLKRFPLALTQSAGRRNSQTADLRCRQLWKSL